MRNCHLDERFPHALVAEFFIERDGRVPGMQFHQGKAPFAGELLGKFDEGPADALSLQMRLDRHLPHANVVRTLWQELQACRQLATYVANEVKAFAVLLDGFLVEGDSQRFPQDFFTQGVGCRVVRRIKRNLSACYMEIRHRSAVVLRKVRPTDPRSKPPEGPKQWIEQM